MKGRILSTLDYTGKGRIYSTPERFRIHFYTGKGRIHSTLERVGYFLHWKGQDAFYTGKVRILSTLERVGYFLHWKG